MALQKQGEDVESVVVGKSDEEAVVVGEVVDEGPVLVENDVFGVVKEKKKVSRVKDLRSKELDSRMLEVERASKSEVEDEWERSSGRAWSLWMILTGVAVLALIGGGVIWAVSRLEDGRAKEAEVEEALDLQQVAEKRETLNAEVLVEEIKAITKRFCEVGTVDDLLPLVRDRERVEPLIRAYYADRKLVPSTLKTIERQIPLELDHRIFWLVSYLEEAGSEPKQILVEQGDREVKLDWESKVIYQPNDWDVFRKERTETASLFRVYLESVEEMAYYGYEFSDYKKYRCFKITLKDKDEYLWGYSEIDSDLDRELMGLFTRSSKGGIKAPAVIEIKYPKDSMSGMCVEIESLLSESWILSK